MRIGSRPHGCTLRGYSGRSGTRVNILRRRWCAWACHAMPPSPRCVGRWLDRGGLAGAYIDLATVSNYAPDHWLPAAATFAYAHLIERLDERHFGAEAVEEIREFDADGPGADDGDRLW